jgi:hypothetical protein
VQVPDLTLQKLSLLWIQGSPLFFEGDLSAIQLILDLLQFSLQGLVVLLDRLGTIYSRVHLGKLESISFILCSTLLSKA